LPLYFRNRAEDFPHRDRFLTVDPALLDTWRQRLSQHGGLKVGISWRAGGKANEGRKRTISEPKLGKSLGSGLRSAIVT
jgi:hypothetical protein